MLGTGRARVSIVASIALAVSALAGNAWAQTATEQTAVSARGLEDHELHDAVLAHRLEVRECVFERDTEIALPPSLHLVVQFVVRADGSVSNASMYRSNSGSPEIDDCIVDVVESVRFPATHAAQQMAVRYPFIFVVAG